MNGDDGFLEALARAAAEQPGIEWAALCRAWDDDGRTAMHWLKASPRTPAADRLGVDPAWPSLERPWSGSGGDRGDGPGWYGAWPVDAERWPGRLLVAGAADNPPAETRELLASLAAAAALFGDPADPGRLIGPAVDRAAAGVSIADARAPDEPLVYVNEQFTRMTGYGRSDVIGRNCRFLQGAERDQEAVAEIREAMAAGRGCEVTLHNFRRDGTPFWNEFRLAPVRDAAGDTTHFIGIQHDVTERETLRQRIEQERAEFRRMIRLLPAGIVIVGDDDGRVLFANPAAEGMLERGEGALAGEPFEVPAEPGQGTEVPIAGSSAAGETEGVAEVSVTQTEWDGRAARMVTLHDVTARRQAEARAERMAYSDTLTGLANRDALHEHLARALPEARRTGGRVALLMLDMDRFKEVNDSLGHAQGDTFLIEVARRLQTVLRDSDVIARVGGDEFAVLLAGSPDASATQTVGEKIAAAFADPIQLGDRRITTSASVGFSLYPADARDAETLMKHADAAMYGAKRAGGGRAVAFDNAFIERARRRLELDQGLATALAEGQFVVHYQPQVRLAPGHPVVGLEALVRWQHPERGLVGPGEFIETLEELDLVGRLTQDVLGQVCQWLRASEQRLPAALNVAVNLSARELRSESLAEDVAGVLEAHGIAPERLNLELTESAVAADVVQAMHSLGDLRARGIRVSLDDFGKGYSALNYLRLLPIDVVKIDREFIRGLPGDAAGSALVRAIVEMAHGIGKRVLAEGVERADQAAYLAELGCDMAQGFYFGRPVPAEELSLDPPGTGDEGAGR